MTYMENLEARIRPLLATVPASGQEEILREVKAIVLESYRNGQKAGASRTQKRETATTAPARKNYKR
jgi:hypothetical protein